MNNLFCAPPDFVTIDNKQYKINTDFRVWIDISNVLDQKISIKEKLCFMLVNAYCDNLPEHMGDAINALFDFMNMNENNTKSLSGEKVIDFCCDKNLIYAAFLQQYRINLFHDYLHWWEFLSLLSCLDENTALMRVIGYRSVDCSKIKDENKKRFFRKMKKRYQLKQEIDDTSIADILTKL